MPDIVVVTRVALGVAQLDVALGDEMQPEPLDAPVHHLGPADQDRRREALVEQHLDRTQDTLLLAVGEHHAHRPLARPLEDRLHHQTRAEHELGQALPVGLEVRDRPGRDPAVHRRPGDRDRQLHREARIERLRDEAVGAERQALQAVGGGDRLGRGGPRDRGDRLGAGDLHLLVDGGRADVQGAPEDEREAQDVVDLIGVVAATGRDQGVGPRGAGVLRLDLGHRVGQRQDQRPFGHGPHHRLIEQTRRRQAEEHVGAFDRVGQRALVGVARKARLVRVHQRGPPGVDHAFDVDHQRAVLAQAELGQKVEAGERRGPGATRREPHLVQALALELQTVHDRRGDDDRGAVLVVVEHRDAHPLAQLRLDLEAFRRLDVLEVDRAERGLERGDDLHQLVRVALVDLDVEGVDPRELLEQDGLAFHHRLGRERTDRAEAEHRGAVADYRDQIAARGQARSFARIQGDLLARRGDPGRIGEREIALVGERFGRGKRDLAGRPGAMIVERGVAQRIGHGTASLPWHRRCQSLAIRSRLGQQRALGLPARPHLYHNALACPGNDRPFYGRTAARRWP